MLIESVDLEEEEKVSQTPRASKRVKSTRKAKESEMRAVTPDGIDDQPLEVEELRLPSLSRCCQEEQEEQEQAPRSCQLLDRLSSSPVTWI